MRTASKKYPNRPSCARHEEGDCLFYLIKCSEVPKDWTECVTQRKQRTSMIGLELE